jgi:hypothetical protein
VIRVDVVIRRNFYERHDGHRQRLPAPAQERIQSLRTAFFEQRSLLIRAIKHAATCITGLIVSH